MHRRVVPKKHEFVHRIFMFYLDLDEIDALSKDISLISRNKFNLHSFYDKDHMEIGGKDVKENIIKYVREKGLKGEIKRIMLLTHLRVFGYVFNPVSFYCIFDKDDNPLCVVPEVGNTFGELKPYFIGKDCYKDDKFSSQQTKYFYVSPFDKVDSVFDFQLKIPGDKLSIRVDAMRDNEKFFYASVTGKKKELTCKKLKGYNLRYPWVTLKVILLIHIHGIILLFKRVPFWWKHINPENQKNVLRSWKGTSGLTN